MVAATYKISAISQYCFSGNGTTTYSRRYEVLADHLGYVAHWQ
jgi:hypothetical protein